MWTRPRTYNAFVANPSLEDYSLRYAPKSFRKWPEWLLASTALGGISFLALEAIGALLVVRYGFTNALFSILLVSAIIFITGLPITYYAARHNIDIDLLSRGAGFGYIGSTITSLIYASFTFIFFAIEASIMAQMVQMYWNIPLVVGYVLCSIIIIPLVFFGVTFINKFQLVTQPIWLVLMILPFVMIISTKPETIDQWTMFQGKISASAGFDLLFFGAASTVAFSLIGQIGEQVDYLRFLPDKTDENRLQWWLAVIFGGPGWIFIGMLKMLGGAFLASIAIGYHNMSAEQAIDPTHMLLTAYTYVFAHPELILAVVTIYIIISQVKINITNAYAGSLAWSNFFARLTHTHVGRVVWLVFNVLVALLLMQFGLLFTLESVLGLYSNLAIAWVGAIFADLTILKPLGISPPFIEFKRAYMHNFNPVGVGAMIFASLLSILCYFGLFGEMLQAFSAAVAFGVSIVCAVLLGFFTHGRFYLAREREHSENFEGNPNSLLLCEICQIEYEYKDMAFCTMINQWICSLCCSLETRCKDYCKKYQDRVSIEFAFNEKVVPPLPAINFTRQLKRFLLYFSGVIFLMTPIFITFYFHSVLAGFPDTTLLLDILTNIYFFVLVILGILVWCLALSKEHSLTIDDELEKNISKLESEIQEHKKTERALQEEKARTDRELFQRKQLSNELEDIIKKRTDELEQTYQSLRQTDKMASLGILVAGMAHEINNPLGFIKPNTKTLVMIIQDLLHLLQAHRQDCQQLEDECEDMTLAGMDYHFATGKIPVLLSGIEEGTERIGAIVENLKNYARPKTLNLDKPISLNDILDASLALTGNTIKKATRSFTVAKDISLSKIYGDMQALEQVVINLVQNACQALTSREQEIKISTFQHDSLVCLRIEDQGSGIHPDNLNNVRDPFFTTKREQGGTGLGLSVSARIVEEHHGFMQIDSTYGSGTVVVISFPGTDSRLKVKNGTQTQIPT